MPLSAEQALKRLSATCARREICEQDALRKLWLWQVPEEEQAAVMAKLIEYDFINEQRYAEAYAEDKLRYNHWGARKVEMMLQRKGIADSVIKAAIERFSDTEAQQSVLEKLLADKARSLKNEDNPYKKKQKLIRFALSRGFEYDDIIDLIS